jgi:hypothetical protein
MKTQRLAAMLAMTAASLCAGQSAVTQKATVIVCMESDYPHALEAARPLTAATFARIGVTIVWHTLDACPVGVDAIHVRLSRAIPGASDYPTSVRNASYGVLAAAQPYGRTIIVFVDRVKEVSRDQGVSVMPSVLVHEITHILERIARHSATGVMKAHWNYEDYLAMHREALAFAQEDIDLIYDGLKIPRATAAAVAAQ